MTSTDNTEDIAAAAQEFYGSDNAFNFYQQVWGGSYIHIGLYSKLEGDDAKLEGVQSLAKASTLSTDDLLSRCFSSDGPAADKCTLMDMGSGYGETARVAAKKYGCKVVCIDITGRENAVNAALTKAAGLEDKVIIPGEKSFFETGMPDASCDVVLSQDSLIHAGFARHKAVCEAARVLKPGGRLVFTDLMQSEEADPKELQEGYIRLHLDDMATPKSYERMSKEYGLEFIDYVDMSENLKEHYKWVRGVLQSRRGDLEGVEEHFVESTARGLDAWASMVDRDLIRWGCFTMTKPAV